MCLCLSIGDWSGKAPECSAWGRCTCVGECSGGWCREKEASWMQIIQGKSAKTHAIFHETIYLVKFAFKKCTLLLNRPPALSQIKRMPTSLGKNGSEGKGDGSREAHSKWARCGEIRGEGMVDI